MNIFALDASPVECVKHYCDKHILKMVVETAQLLCTAHHAVYIDLEKRGFDVAKLRARIPYKCTHLNHPCSKWARETVGNYTWLLYLGFALCEEYTKRFGKVHASEAKIIWCYKNKPKLPLGMLTPWPQCMPEKYRCLDGEPYTASLRAYRRYYAYKLRDFRKRGICQFRRV